MQKKKKKKQQQQKHSTTATAHCNWQTDSGTDRRTDGVTVGLAAVGQPHNTRWVSCTPIHTHTHWDTLRHTGTPRQGVSSHSLAAVPGTRLGTPAWGHHQHQHHNCSPNWGPCFDGSTSQQLYFRWRLCKLQLEKKAKASCDLCVGCETSTSSQMERESSSSSSSLINWSVATTAFFAFEYSLKCCSTLSIYSLLYFNYISFKCQQSCTTFFFCLVKQNAKKQQNLLLDCDWSCYCCCGGCSCESHCTALAQAAATALLCPALPCSALAQL